MTSRRSFSLSCRREQPREGSQSTWRSSSAYPTGQTTRFREPARPTVCPLRTAVDVSGSRGAPAGWRPRPGGSRGGLASGSFRPRGRRGGLPSGSFGLRGRRGGLPSGGLGPGGSGGGLASSGLGPGGSRGASPTGGRCALLGCGALLSWHGTSSFDQNAS